MGETIAKFVNNGGPVNVWNYLLEDANSVAFVLGLVYGSPTSTLLGLLVPCIYIFFFQKYVKTHFFQ